MPFPKLLRHISVGHNRARHKLRKHGHKNRKLQEIFLCRYVAPVHINHIGHGLEGVKRNADGKRQVYAAVFKKTEHGKIDCKGGKQKVKGFPLPSVSLYQHAMQIIRYRGKQHQHNINRFAPSVKQKAPRKEHNVFSLFRCQKIQ